MKHEILKALTEIEDRIDAAKFKLRQRLGLGKLQIIPYMGYGTRDELILKGRVLRDKGIREPMDNASLFTNLVDMYRRFQSDEIPGATVRARFLENTVDTITNVEGFFEFRFTPTVLPESQSHTYLVDLELIDYPGKALNPVEPAEFKAQGQIIVPPPDAQFGVISDVDDTVLRSNVADVISLVRNTFLENARTRLPFEGVAKFYQALRRGVSGENFNPIFYVSSSVWNLYDVLHDFFVVREIPLGGFFLAEYNLDENTFIVQDHHTHKMAAINTILAAYPDLPFILIGDSGQKDPVIYAEIVRQYPGRVLAIYIRDVSKGKERDEDVLRISAEMAELSVPMLLAPDSYTAAQHAANHGWIHPNTLPTIREERNEDQQAPTPLEEALNLPPGTEPGRE
jgi:phosphatidate phosphatase APP1